MDVSGVGQRHLHLPQFLPVPELETPNPQAPEKLVSFDAKKRFPNKLLAYIALVTVYICSQKAPESETEEGCRLPPGRRSTPDFRAAFLFPESGS